MYTRLCLNLSFFSFFLPFYLLFLSFFLPSFTFRPVRALIGVADRLPIAETEELLNTTGIHLLLPSLDPSASGQSWASDIQSLYSGNPQTSLGWSLSRANVGHLATTVTPKQLRLYEIMLFTLPGTPVFNYGDEIGLEDQVRRGEGERLTRGGKEERERERGEVRRVSRGFWR